MFMTLFNIGKSRIKNNNVHSKRPPRFLITAFNLFGHESMAVRTVPIERAAHSLSKLDLSDSILIWRKELTLVLNISHIKWPIGRRWLPFFSKDEVWLKSSTVKIDDFFTCEQGGQI